MNQLTDVELAAIREYLAGRETLLGNAAIRSILVRMHNDATKPMPKQADGMDSVTAAETIKQLTDQLVAQGHECRRLRSSLQTASDAMDAEVWDARWTNRLMQAHVIARDTLEQVAAGEPAPATEPEWIQWRQKRDANIIDRLCKRVAALESLVEVE